MDKLRAQILTLGATPEIVNLINTTKTAILKIVASKPPAATPTAPKPAEVPRPLAPAPLTKTKSTGGPPSLPPSPAQRRNSMEKRPVIKKGPPAVPAAALAKARQAAMGKGMAPRGPPRGPPAPPRNPRGPPPPGPPGAPAASAPSPSKSPAKETEEEEPRELTEEERKNNLKKRFSGNGGVQLFNPGLGALGMGNLKKTTRPSSVPKTSDPNAGTFVKPSLKKVQRPSEKVKSFDENAGIFQKPELNKVSSKPIEEATEDEGGDEEIPEEEAEEEVVEEATEDEEVEWEERWDEANSLPYYFNEKTQEASWDVPAKFKPMPALDFEWVEKMDETHKVPYYQNVKTGEAVWEAPEKFKAMVLEEGGAEGVGEVKEEEEFEWVEIMDETHGVPYYQNSTTGEAVWEAPEKFKPIS
ncbi:hypothetical protein TrST_g4795 [Triparma strigata]|nr:hypothetical protein TrST_g4795 [Triparma strigata]